MPVTVQLPSAVLGEKSQRFSVVGQVDKVNVEGVPEWLQKIKDELGVRFKNPDAIDLIHKERLKRKLTQLSEEKKRLEEESKNLRTQRSQTLILIRHPWKY